VLIEATPRSNRFTIDGEAFEFYHGMNGRVEVRVRSESILVSLVPGLRTIFGRSRDE
jgi:membrane fusion protein (multidrug efflux system)